MLSFDDFAFFSILSQHELGVSWSHFCQNTTLWSSLRFCLDEPFDVSGDRQSREASEMVSPCPGLMGLMGLNGSQGRMGLNKSRSTTSTWWTLSRQIPPRVGHPGLDCVCVEL